MPSSGKILGLRVYVTIPSKDMGGDGIACDLMVEIVRIIVNFFAVP
jgi:hypothetical protein